MSARGGRALEKKRARARARARGGLLLLLPRATRRERPVPPPLSSPFLPSPPARAVEPPALPPRRGAGGRRGRRARRCGAMDWSAVEWSEVADSLREVEWSEPPRPFREFLGGRFGAPKTKERLVARLKCNLYYYRTNYAAVIAFAFAFMFWRNPWALVALGLVAIAALCYVDTFAAALSERLVRLAKKVSPPLAAKMRSRGGNAPPAAPGASRRRGQPVRICGVDRALVAGGASLVSALALWATDALTTLAWAVFMGLGFSLAHASLRAPNLKARCVRLATRASLHSPRKTRCAPSRFARMLLTSRVLAGATLRRSQVELSGERVPRGVAGLLVQRASGPHAIESLEGHLCGRTCVAGRALHSHPIAVHKKYLH